VIVLGIESSCDETAAAVVTDGRKGAGPRLLANVVASQTAVHRPYGGVVPELASRSHIRFITDVIEGALKKARLPLARIDAVAATAGPGLPGSLLVGLTAGKAMAYLLGKPFVAVNHTEGHIYSAFLAEPGLKPPLLALVASGGHTELIACPNLGVFRILGRTRDDAAGEAYDKAGKLLGLAYPGGPGIEKLARGARTTTPLPVARMKDGSLDFSFSGLKTAVREAALRVRGRAARAGLAAGFERAVGEALAGQTRIALRSVRARTLVLAGGVAANGALRERLRVLAAELSVRFVVPPPALCTDNAAMIAAAGWYLAKRRKFSPLATPADSSWDAGSPPPRAEVRGASVRKAADGAAGPNP